MTSIRGWKSCAQCKTLKRGCDYCEGTVCPHLCAQVAVNTHLEHSPTGQSLAPELPVREAPTDLTAFALVHLQNFPSLLRASA